jgi:hypothetical protein
VERYKAATLVARTRQCTGLRLLVACMVVEEKTAAIGAARYGRARYGRGQPIHDQKNGETTELTVFMDQQEAYAQLVTMVKDAPVK